MILPELINDDVEDDRDTEIRVERIHREERMLVASMEPNVVFVEDVLLEMRDLNISHNLAEDLNHCPYIEIDRK